MYVNVTTEVHAEVETHSLKLNEYYCMEPWTRVNQIVDHNIPPRYIA